MLQPARSSSTNASNQLLLEHCLVIACYVFAYVAIALRTLALSTELTLTYFELTLMVGPLFTVVDVLIRIQNSRNKFQSYRVALNFTAASYAIPYLVLLYTERIPFNELFFVVTITWVLHVSLSESILIAFISAIVGCCAFPIAAKNYSLVEFIVCSGILSLVVCYERSQRRGKSECDQQQTVEQISSSTNRNQVKLLLEVSKLSKQENNGNYWTILPDNSTGTPNTYNSILQGVSPADFIANAVVLPSGKKAKKHSPLELSVYLENFIDIIYAYKLTLNDPLKKNKKAKQTARLSLLDKQNSKPTALITITVIEKPAQASSGNDESKLYLELAIEADDEQKQFYKHYLKYQKRVLQKSMDKVLSSITGITMMALSAEFAENLGQTTNNYVNVLRKIKHASQMAEFSIKGAIDFMKGKYPVTSTPFNFKQTLSDFVNDYQSTIRETGVQLILVNNARDVRTISNDASRVLQVLSILIDNSVAAFAAAAEKEEQNKHVNGHVIIKVQKSRDPRCLTIEIDDQGSGIVADFKPPYARPKTLEQAKQNATEPIRMGLFNLNKIIQRIGPEQELTLKSVKGIGTKISFKIFRNLAKKDEMVGVLFKEELHDEKNASENNRSNIRNSQTKFKHSLNIVGDNEIEEESHNQLSDDGIADYTAKNYRQKQSQQHSFNKTTINNDDQMILSPSSAVGLLNSITCIDDSMKSDIDKSANIAAASGGGSGGFFNGKKLYFSMLSQKQSPQSSSNRAGSATAAATVADGLGRRSKNRIKSVMILEAGAAVPSDATNSPKVSSSDVSPKQKSILKRSKHTQPQLNVSDKGIMSASDASQKGFEIELDGLTEEQIALQMEEFSDSATEKQLQFVIRKSNMQKKLSHLSDYSRAFIPLNMLPSTTVFSNSRLGNDNSPKNHQLRHSNRTSTFNFTEIDKDF